MTNSRNSSSRPDAPDTGRFSVTKATLRLDAIMNRSIFIGGLMVIFTISGIFLFILLEVLPLFGGATVREKDYVATGIQEPLLLGADEWTERPFIADKDGVLSFFDIRRQVPPQIEAPPLPAGVTVTSAVYVQKHQTVVYGLSNGQYLLGAIDFQPRFAGDGTRRIGVSVEWDTPLPLGGTSAPVVAIDMSVSGTRKTIAGIQETATGLSIPVVSLQQERSLFGAYGFTLDRQSDLIGSIDGEPVQVLVGANAESVVVRVRSGMVHAFNWSGEEWDLRQAFSPFDDESVETTSMNFIQGSVSLTLTSTAGDHVVYSLYRSDESGERLYGQTRTFKRFPGGASGYASSLRNKAFLIGNSERISLRYSTTGDVRWEASLNEPLTHLLIGGKYDRILGVDSSGMIRLFTLEDPHPEAGLMAFFGKIWYEGQDEPQYLWQSTGGTDDFEPKLSLVPLMVGTLKGTFYAMLFALPVALLAAIYTSQFLSPTLKRFIKPSIEIMASLPSVVLGFLAALWLAPLIEDRVPSIILIAAFIPLSAILIGFLWSRLPLRMRILVPRGWEFICFLPVIGLVSILGWELGPVFESIAFPHTDPVTGQVTGDFRLWWEALAGSQFQQRNSLVVGFIMGFAVIPIIFTISEDALSAVPQTLTSGSLALGASRWQTTVRVVIPTASAGIFSAVMIGLGRAIGETMIVVMATGNTPIMDLDVFSGMRTLSANIAVELPEAPHGGTLYRTLFLGAVVLFVLTFAVNTVAEVLRTRLRERFKVIH